MARWITTGRLGWPSVSMYSHSMRSGSIVKSTWIVASCHCRASVSSTSISIFGP